MSEWTIHQGDCVEEMAKLEEASIDAVVCDPPYGIGFMGHEWDQPGEHGPVAADGEGVALQSGRRRVSQPKTTVSFGGDPHAAMEAGRYDLSLTANRRYQGWCEAWAREASRVLKPGGHLLASCGTRTVHRMTSGIEDAGFEIRDTILWLYGSGFPKSHNLDGENEGKGTALKPAHEPMVVARKPLVGTVASNVLENGTGCLNIDACRLEARDDQLAKKYASVADAGPRKNAIFGRDRRTEPHGAGRWPANVVLSHTEDCGEQCAPGCPVAALDAQSGQVRSAGEYSKGARGVGQKSGAASIPIDGLTSATYADSGGASRFFYCAKASREERNAGLDRLPGSAERLTTTPMSTIAKGRSGGKRVDDRDYSPAPNANFHPTVKPINLMRWLVRLVTPPGATVLDPFTGSGSTGCAAVLEGFDFIGIEREAEYVAIATARIAFWAQHEGREVELVLGLNRKQKQRRVAQEESGQPLLPGLETHAI